MKHPKVVIKKLGRQQAYGQYVVDAGVIEIDPRTKGKKHLEVMIHEYLHHLHPEWTEEKVTSTAEVLSDFLWKNHYRRVEP